MAIDELEGIATYIFKWNALSDACPKCRRLNGREWRDQNIYQEVLWDPWYGNIWDLYMDHSLAHGTKQYNCRCQLTVRVECDWSKSKWFRELNETICDGGGNISSNIQEAKRELQELKAEMQDMRRELRAYRNLLYDTANLATLLGVKEASDIRRMIALLIQLKAAYDAVQVARLAAGDPLAWFGVGVSVVTTGVNMVNVASGSYG